MSGAPVSRGLYNPELEKDACGVGFIVNIKGNATRQVLEDAAQSVLCMAHRGALGADPLTGDGAGVMTAIPHKFFQKIAEHNKWELPQPGHYAVGNIFMHPTDEEIRISTRDTFGELALRLGLSVIGWRDVPTESSHLGQGSHSSEPKIQQVIVQDMDRGQPPVKRQRKVVLNLDQKLYILRKRASHKIPSENMFYVCSLSSKVIVYKGQLTPHQLFLYYAADLHHPLYTSHFALVHTRFSTNTFPSWDRAQPCRMLAHNGEINTLRGNLNLVRSREGLMRSETFGQDILSLFPIVDPYGSDSQALDNLLEFLVLDGQRTLPEVVMTLVPEAWENDASMDPSRKAFYQWAASIQEPWDGPGLFCFSDGRYVGAVLDRNGLRPSRYYVTDEDTVIMASEVGVVVPPAHSIISKRRLQPGKMLLIDTVKGLIIDDATLKKEICGSLPYEDWIKNNVITMDKLAGVEGHSPVHQLPNLDEGVTDPRLICWNYTQEQLDRLIIPMIEQKKEALGSMGNDAALACLDEGPRLVFEYFKQLFAQVTNPPIDPFREAVVMSLLSYIGPEVNALARTEAQCHRLRLNYPVLSIQELKRIQSMHYVKGLEDWKVQTIDITFPVEEGTAGLKAHLTRACQEVDNAIQQGFKIAILSDRAVGPDRVPIPSLLAVGAVHQYLVKNKRRLLTSLVIETGEAREVHHMCCLLGFGADAVCPYLVYETIQLAKNVKVDAAAIESNYITAAAMGIKKVMAKMGISTLASYKGAQIFEAVGIGKEVIEMCFTNTASRIGGLDFNLFAKDQLLLHKMAYPNRKINGVPDLLPIAGEYHNRTGGRAHTNDPSAIANLQHATRQKNKQAYKAFATFHDKQIEKCCLRGLLEFRQVDRGMQVPLIEVEPAANIVKRFVTGAMSYGSISAEAHTALAVAMNRIGGKSNTGEGGEDPSRFATKPSGDSERSAIKQVASGRFGVTIEYLVNAIEIQIKMAQGAKPGEGGELPGHKVSAEIAKTRHSTTGVGLISPPPHHDIYSIEDLAQLIYDMKCANPTARISVKLVSEVGVGVVAAGVAKGHADHITVSGHDGGTGASSWTGVKHAGLPWELGLAEAHQTLVLNNLRGRVVLQTDGQLRSGRDVVVASMLGADEFAFSTAPLIVLGCTMMRKCHLNTCPVGIATQDPVLRKKFDGQPEHVVNYFFMVAEEIRQYMSSMGFRTMEEMTGRSDMLIVNEKVRHEKSKTLDLYELLTPAFRLRMGVPTTPCQRQDHNLQTRIDYQVITRVAHTIRDPNLPSYLELKIGNADRDFGTTLSYEVCKKTNGQCLPDDSIHLKLFGSAGQSLGAFLCHGITIELIGDSNDYVGKGLSGGKIMVRPAKYHTQFVPENNVIVGNACLYGATSGEAYFRGIAGERFCVRNSGAIAVVEGVGDHGCEYMTGGRAIILGPTGRNFAAGMSGGLSYVFDPFKEFPDKCNQEMCRLEKVKDAQEKEWLHNTISKHHQLTGSDVAERLLNDWSSTLDAIVKVFPNDLRRVMEQDEAAEKQKASERSKSRFTKPSAPVLSNKTSDIEDLGQPDKVQGFVKYDRKGDHYVPPEQRAKSWEEMTSRLTHKELAVQAARCMECGVPFCQTEPHGCPLGNLIPDWNDLVHKNDYRHALLRLLATNPFPEFTGRVCPAPCEGACVLGINASPVSIKSIECAIIDKGFEEGWIVPQPPRTRTGKKVAIIGSGPAGMACAQLLNYAGHTVVVYERATEVGGLLRFGIPNMKLDKSIVQRRAKIMEDEGVKWVTKSTIGVDIHPKELLKENDALCLCIGSTWPRDLAVSGRNLNGIHFAMDFLGENFQGLSATGKDVLVIGGGDTSTDCIGTSLRQGAKSITSFVYMPQPGNNRSTDNPWPQWPRTFRVDYGHAEAKAVYGSDPRWFGVLTKSFIGDENGNVKACQTVNVAWNKDSTGRLQMQELPGSQRTWPCDIVFLAMGYMGPEGMLTELLELPTDSRCNHLTESGKYRTGVPRVYSAGDCRRGQSLVVTAINEGRQAAREIDADLMHGGQQALLPLTGGLVRLRP